MDLKERAKFFAIEAHRGQVRKNEPDKPMIIHPIGVGKLLEDFGYDDIIVAAGYLHDVVEDTQYTIDDLKSKFGEEVANLVMGASEPDKSLSWEERKMHTINVTRDFPLRNKLVICADKINNLEDLMIKFQKCGKRDFSAFKRGEEQQKWYYTGVYESLVFGEDEELPLFKRLKDVLDIVFYEKEDLYLRDNIFDDNSEYYEKLKKLHAQKVELQKLKMLCSLSKPFVIEFCGTPRTGKTTTIYNLYDFFKKGGFNTTVIEEFTTSKYYKDEFRQRFKDLGVVEFHMAIVEEVIKQLENTINSDNDVILIDRSINDRQIWNYRKYVSGDMSEEIYQELRKKCSEKSEKLIDSLVITYADPITSLKRDYNSSLALEKRRFLNVDNLSEYNNALKDLFVEDVENTTFLDTTSMSMNDVSIEVASQVMPIMRKKYIKSFKEKYGI